MPSIRYYGPGIGETWHDATHGPLGVLRPMDVALSPDLARKMGLRYGDTFPYKGQIYRYADASYIKPGHPNKNTIEFWVPPKSGPQTAPTPGETTDNPFADVFASIMGDGSFAQPSPGEISDNPFKGLTGTVSAQGAAGVGAQNPEPPNEKFSPIDYWSAMNPAPHEEAGPTPVDQWPAWNPVPQNEQISPVDTWSGMNPAPQNEQISSADQWSPMNPAPANEQFSPVNWFATNPEPWNETPSPVDTYSTGTVYGEGSASVGDPFAGASVEGEAPLYDPFAGATVEGEAPFNPFAGATASASAAYKQKSSAQAGSSQPAWVNAPHTGEVFQSTIVDPNTGRISMFDPTTGGYTPIAGPAGWTNTGYGAGSPYGAGSAGYGGGGFGGYGGLGGTGAPVTGHVGGMVDTSTPEGLSHGGVDPTSGSSPGPGGPGSVVKGMTVGEAGIRSEDNPRGIAQWQAQQDYLDSLGGPVQRYISGYVHQKYFGLGGHMSQQKSGPDYGGGHGYMAPVYTTDPALALPANVIPFPATLSPVDAAALLTGTHG